MKIKQIYILKWCLHVDGTPINGHLSTFHSLSTIFQMYCTFRSWSSWHKMMHILTGSSYVPRCFLWICAFPQPTRTCTFNTRQNHFPNIYLTNFDVKWMYSGKVCFMFGWLSCVCYYYSLLGWLFRHFGVPQPND